VSPTHSFKFFKNIINKSLKIINYKKSIIKKLKQKSRGKKNQKGGWSHLAWSVCGGPATQKTKTQPKKQPQPSAKKKTQPAAEDKETTPTQ
jgi:hypothetical protein